MTASQPASRGLFPGPGLFPALGPELRRDLEALLPLIEKTFPVPARFRRALPSDAAELSRLLTSARGERPLSYLNRPPLLSAYLRCFLPWNLYRLCRLLPSLELPLAAGDRILDLGAGPLTFPAALWLCRPEFRGLPLEFRCLDRSRAALDAGKALFSALTASGPPCPWTITAVCGELDRRADADREGRRPRLPAAAGSKQGAALTAVLNVYNELFQSISPADDGGLYRLAETQGALLAAHAGEKGRILIVEPGVPRSGRFISLLREVLTGLGRPPLSPCVHDGPCPFPGPVRGAGFQAPRGPGGRDPEKGASKWCHFAFDTRDAPAALRRFSAAAGLPKERAVLSFLLAGPAAPDSRPVPAASRTRDPDDVPPVPGGRVPCFPLRIISDPFPLGAGGGSREWGRYGCFKGGMALVRGGEDLIESLPPGTLAEAAPSGRRDPKSGALLCRVGEAD